MVGSKAKKCVCYYLWFNLMHGDIPHHNLPICASGPISCTKQCWGAVLGQKEHSPKHQQTWFFEVGPKNPFQIEHKPKIKFTGLNLDRQIIFRPIFSHVWSIFSYVLGLAPKNPFLKEVFTHTWPRFEGLRKGHTNFQVGAVFLAPDGGKHGIDKGGRGDSPPWSKIPKKNSPYP